MTLLRDLRRTHFRDAVQAEYSQECRWLHWTLGVQCRYQRESPVGHFFVHLSGLRGKLGEEFTRGLGWVEAAVGGEHDGGVEGKEGGADAGKHILAGGVEVVVGGGKKQKRSLQPGDELRHHAEEGGRASLDGENGRHGVGGPRAELN